MAQPNLFDSIYEQILYFVEIEMDKLCNCPFDECAFSKEVCKNRECRTIMIITWTGSKCKKPRTECIEIDITRVKYCDLDDQCILKKLRECARSFVAIICPPKYQPRQIVECPKPKKCWVPYETETVTTVLLEEAPCKPEPPKVVKKYVTAKCVKNPIPKDETVIYEYCNKDACGEQNYCESKSKYHNFRGNVAYNDKVYNVDANKVSRVIIQ